MNELPTLDDRYVLERRIGKGSMGVVYRGRRTSDDLPVAIKLIHGELTRDPEVRERFEREVRMTAKVDHPGIVRVLDRGLSGENLYLVMDLLVGRTLGQVCQQEAPLPAERVAEIGRQLALALDAAHQAGLVHRDLKPENVMVCKDEVGADVVRVLDFGLAIHTNPAQRDGARLTAQGLRLGTPAFMAPEYITTGQLDHRSDLYAVGLMLYELACGRLPFEGQGFKLMQHHLMTTPPPLASMCAAPPWLADVIDRLILKDPAARPSSGRELAAALVPG